MSELQIIIAAILALIFFVTYLLIGLLSKISESSKDDHLKTMGKLE
jgi:preprotein translocase subunit SecG